MTNREKTLFNRLKESESARDSFQQNCYALGHVVREIAKLLAESEFDDAIRKYCDPAPEGSIYKQLGELIARARMEGVEECQVISSEILTFAERNGTLGSDVPPSCQATSTRTSPANSGAGTSSRTVRCVG